MCAPNRHALAHFHMCKLLPKMCHQMSPPSASFNLAKHPVIILSLLSLSVPLSRSLSLSHSHFHTFPQPVFLSLLHPNPRFWLELRPSLSLAHITSTIFVFILALLAPRPSPTIVLFILFSNISRLEDPILLLHPHRYRDAAGEFC